MKEKVTIKPPISKQSKINENRKETCRQIIMLKRIKSERAGNSVLILASQI